jgi:hypothetical protein
MLWPFHVTIGQLSLYNQKEIVVIQRDHIEDL